MAGRTYDRMAPIYERLTDAYSFGCVPRAKKQQLDLIEPGMRVLYAGIGPGSDAVGAAQKGAAVTGIDISSRMVEIASRRFAAADQNSDLHHCDLFAFEPEAPYDVVVANFLLDCFDDEQRPQVVARLGDFVRHGGMLLVADTGMPRGSVLGQVFWRVYHGIAFTSTWVQGITPWLPVMNQPAYLRDAGFSVADHTLIRPWRRGPVLFESVVGIAR